MVSTTVLMAEKQEALLGLRVFTEAHKRGMSVRQLAKHAHLPLSTVQKICAGEGKQPSAWTIVQLAVTLGVSTDYLLGVREATP